MPNFSGKWTLAEQAQGAAAGTWTGLTQYELYSWGDGTSADSAITDTINPLPPVQVGALLRGIRLRLELLIASPLKPTVRCGAGANDSGRLGLNDNLSLQPSSNRRTHYVVSDFGWRNLHSLAIKTDGTMWSWGNNASGRLGLNDTANRSSPVQIGALTTWSQIAAGNAQNVALKTDGTLWSWGNGTNGQLGHNIAISRSSPVQIGALTTWSQIAAGSTQFRS
jgi:alpha-tubulin suppressor-like RCC1 family protein